MEAFSATSPEDADYLDLVIPGVEHVGLVRDHGRGRRPAAPRVPARALGEALVTRARTTSKRAGSRAPLCLSRWIRQAHAP